MLFQTPEFLLFLVVFMAVLTVSPGKIILPVVVLFSLFFYAAWYWPYVGLLVALCLIGWWGARTAYRRPGLTWLVVVLALCPLAVFKYANFGLGNVEALLGAPMPRLDWALPLGISFVTFTLISLIVDTANRRNDAPPSLINVATYVTVFPHLLAGPILRAGQIMPQLGGVRARWDVLGASLALFTVGIMKKVLIADPIGLYVDSIHAAPGEAGALEAVVAFVGFGVQIYCDFSAYSDMAIALAALMGLTFPENFGAPFASKSVTEFWRRWHITLGTWLRDYVLLPLTRKTILRWMGLSLFATMLISGLWHGANWTFVLWGALNGVIMMVERLTGFAKYSEKSRGALKATFIVMHFVTFISLLILFRSASLPEAGDFAMSLLGANGLGRWPVEGGLVLMLSALILVPHGWDRAAKIQALGARLNPFLAWPALLLIIGVCTALAASRPTAFYYFDF